MAEAQGIQLFAFVIAMTTLMLAAEVGLRRRTRGRR